LTLLWTGDMLMQFWRWGSPINALWANDSC
jgi:hypothetical protein